MKLGKILLICLLSILAASCEKDNGESGYPVEQSSSFPVPSSSEAVDLGLSVKWAPYNIGASEPSEYGNYYAWGETDFKELYTAVNYSKPETDTYGGITDGIYDAACKQWGNGWRLPSKKEIEELENLCSKTEQTTGKIRGIKYTGPNGNSIFLPAAGYVTNRNVKAAGIKGFYTCGSGSSPNSIYFTDSLGREAGLSVRPVIDIEYNIEIDSIMPRTENFYFLKTNNGNSIVYNAYVLINSSDKSSYLEEYGVAIYRNNELYAEFKSTDNTAQIRIESKIDDLEVSTAPSGSKIYSTKNSWSAGTYYVKKDYNGKNVKFYCTGKEALDLNYYANYIEILGIEMDSTQKIQYLKINDEKLLDFRFRANIQIDTIDESVRDYGIVIYKNNKIFTYCSATYGTGNVNCILCPTYNSMKISRNDSGEYIASTSGVWTIGTFIVRRNSDNYEHFYEFHDNIVPLELTYKKRPDINIKTFTYTEPQKISAEGAVKSNVNIHFMIDGGFFLKNADMSITNEYMSKSNYDQIDSQILSFNKLFHFDTLYDDKGYWYEDATFLMMSDNIISFTDSNKGDEISREATISFNTYLEHDGTKLSTKKLNYKLLHNGTLSVNYIE